MIMIDFEKYDNYVFDLYGTLIDIRTDEHDIRTWERWAAWLDEHGYRHDTPQNMHEIFFAADRAARVDAKANWGFEYPEIDVVPIYKEMLRMGDAPACNSDSDGYSDGYSDGDALSYNSLSAVGYAFRCASREYMRLFPGVTDFIEAIHKAGKRTYLLSNAQRCYTWPEICELGLDKLLDDVLISSDERCMKPDRAFFGAMAAKHGFDGSRTIMFGDSYENDYMGAINAGWHAVHLAGENEPARFYCENTQVRP